MSTKDTDGQAFPCYERGSAGAGPLELTDPGMTLRDYFAAKAIEGACSGDSGIPDGLFCEAAAARAYKLADAMLKARTE